MDCPHEALIPSVNGWCFCQCGAARAPTGPPQLKPSTGLALPTYWSQSLEDEVVAMVQAGARPAVAMRACGVGPNLWARWQKLGEEGRQPYAQLCRRIDQAAYATRAVAEGRVFSEKPENWLERMHPGTANEPGWAREQRVKVEGKIEHLHGHVDLTQLSLEELRARRAELASAEPQASLPSAPTEDDAIDVEAQVVSSVES